MIIEEMIRKYKIMFVDGLGIYIYSGKVWEKKSDNYMLKVIGKQMGKWKIGSRGVDVYKRQAKTDAGRVKRLTWMIERLEKNLKPMS